jgi:chromosome segregation ATPase
MSDHKCIGYGCAVCELKEAQTEEDDLRSRLAAAEARAERAEGATKEALEALSRVERERDFFDAERNKIALREEEVIARADRAEARAGRAEGERDALAKSREEWMRRCSEKSDDKADAIQAQQAAEARVREVEERAVTRVAELLASLDMVNLIEPWTRDLRAALASASPEENDHE